MASQNRGLGRGLSALLGLNDLNQQEEKNPVAVETEKQQPQPQQKQEVKEPVQDKQEITHPQGIVSDKGAEFMRKVEETGKKIIRPVVATEENSVLAINISVKDIDPNSEQPRKNFDEDSLKE